jgi:hypothetical protein
LSRYSMTVHARRLLQAANRAPAIGTHADLRELLQHSRRLPSRLDRFRVPCGCRPGNHSNKVPKIIPGMPPA